MKPRSTFTSSSLLTIVVTVGCAALAIFSPGWRTLLLAETSYHGGLRMTGGGTIGSSGFKHGFALDCAPSGAQNGLEVNWGKGNKFHLETLTSASCSDDPSINGTNGFDTYDGAGTGRFNGAPGANAEWTFTDAGEPGDDDFAEIIITDPAGNVFSASGLLSKGNHQAHGN